MSDHTLHVCPICHEQADWSDDYGWTLVCIHDPYQAVEAVEVGGTVENGRLVFTLPDPEEWKRTVGAAMLADQERRRKEREEWLALSCDERAEIKRKQRESAGRPLMPDSFMFTMIEPLLYHQKTITYPCAKCGDAGCENAVTKENPNYRPSFDFSGGFTIRGEGGSTA